MKNIADMSHDERLNHVLDGINLAELKQGNTDECLRFYQKNLQFISALATSFCNKELGKNSSYVDDLVNEIYLYIPRLNYSDYGALCKSMRRVFYLCTISDRDELNFARWDTPVNDESETPLSEIAVTHKLDNTPISNSQTLKKSIYWLQANLSPKYFKYAYLRFIELADTQTIFRKLGYSPLCGDSFIARLDRHVMTYLCEKHTEACEFIGGIFDSFKYTLPFIIEKRKNAMTNFHIRKPA